MTRRRKLGLIVLAALAVLGGLVAWALPEVVRRVAVAQLPAALGRAVSIEDIDLNLFTGRFAVKRLRLAEREGPEAFVELERLDGRIWLLGLLGFDVRLTELRLAGPAVRLIRTGPTEFNFSDLVALMTKADPAQKPSRWTYTVDRLAVADGRVRVEDYAVTPAADWSLRDLQVEGGGISTNADRPPGRLSLRVMAGAARLDVDADSLKLAPVIAAARVGLTGFDLARLRPYMPPDAPAFAEQGVLGVALAAVWKREPGRIESAYVSGDVTVEGLALSQAGRSAPFLAVPGLAVTFKQADLIARDITVGSIEVNGLDARVARDRGGRIDVLEAMRAGETSGPGPAKAEAPPAAPAPAAEPAPSWAVRVERVAVRKARLALADDAVAPRRDWRLEDLSLDAGGLSTVAADPAGTLEIKTQIAVSPGPAAGAALSVTADSLRLVPLAASARVSLSGFDLTTANPYLPRTVPATPAGGILAIDLDARAEQGPTGPVSARLSGRVEVRDLAAVKRGEAAAFLSMKRLMVGIQQADLLGREVRLGSVSVNGLDARASRRHDGSVDLLAMGGEAGPASPAPPAAAARGGDADAGAWRLRLDRLALDGRVTVVDEALSPPRQWTLEGVKIDGAGLSTAPKDPPGTLSLKADLRTSPGQAPPAALGADITGLRLIPFALTARVTLEGFDVTGVAPYVPEATPARPSRGRLAVDLTAALQTGSAGLERGTVTGAARLDDLAVVQRGGGTPFFSAPSVAVSIKAADIVARTVAVAAVTVDGMQARVVRDPAGVIDLTALAQATPERAVEALAEAVSTPAAPVAGASPPTAPAPGPPVPQWQVGVDRFAVTRGTMTFEDQLVSPATTLSLTDVTVTAERLGWPATGQATLAVSVGMPGGGRTEVKGTMVLQPLDTQLAMSTRDAPIEPYQVYFPFAARLTGFFSGDSLNEVQRGPAGELILASRGAAWARDLEVRAPGAEKPVARLAALDIRGIDFSWPNYALVDKVTLNRPEVEVERDAGGAMNLTTLFAVRQSTDASSPEPAATPAPAPAEASAGAAPAGPSSGAPGRDIVIDVKDILIEDGYGRFIDRTTRPAFSETLSRLTVTVHDLSTVMGRRRTTLVAQGVVGGDGALDLRGELSGIGETFRADLVGDLKNFTLASTNPYADALTAWIVESGTLTARVHYRVEGDRLSAEHDVEFAGLKVERARESEEARKRLGLPLGLAVAMLKDRRGNIDFSVPLHGTLSDRSFDWGEAMWAGVKQVLLKVLAAPFSAIGRLFTPGGDAEAKLAVDPVTFAPGSSVIAPDTERQLTRIADFLRRAPYVGLRLSAVGTAADAQSLRALAVTRRLERFQRDNGLADTAAALRAYYQRYATDVTLPKTPEEQLALLIEREPVPAEALADLLQRRLEATRDRLVKTEGLPAERVTVPAAPPAAAGAPAETGAGRVEFAVVAGGE